ncbi:RAMP superfamily CRISPR-associated protein [Desulfobacter sp. UBA2225]|uniref:RAMP superfamily CRISPR-associated protein n=1 Tax=Desulfobacter sp. UBA2225 TaxID=1961413 RepID=UPI00257B7961|nr:RAMP superfamily CRISPR-associated protein [Desulfobacter sp. UBA2225]
MYHNLELTLNIQFESIWYTGSGEADILTDRLLQKDARGRPYFPASTLKGVIRESCEKLSRTLNFPEPSDPHSIDMNLPGAFGPLCHAPSPVDRLFGNKFEEGGLYFRNAYPIDNTDHVDRFTHIRSRVKMHRKLGTVKEKHLFTTEYAFPMTFESKLSASHRNLAIFEETDPPFAYCLLIAAIKMVDRLGGDKSTGAGHLHQPISITQMIYNDTPFSADTFLKEKGEVYLDASDYQEMRE